MALAYDVDGTVVQAVIIGSHSLSEVRALLDAGLADPRAASPLRVLVDASNARFPEETLENVCLSADALASRHAVLDCRCAIVVRQPLRRLLSWTLSAYVRRHGVEVRLFASAAEANAWLANPASALPGPRNHTGH